MMRLRSWVLDHFDQAVLEEKSLHGQLKFSVLASANIFRYGSRHSSTALRDTKLRSKGPDYSFNELSVASISPLASKPGAELHVDHRNAAGAIFAALEANRDLLELESYSVSPSALEEVFLNVVGKHARVEQAASRKGWRRWLSHRWAA